MRKIILEKNLPHIPNKLISDIFLFFKQRFYLDSYKYSIATQKKFNRENNLPSTYCFDKIYNDFKKFIFDESYNKFYKDIEFSAYDFPGNYQKRLLQFSQKWKIRVGIYREAFALGFFNSDDIAIGLKNDMMLKIYYDEDGNKEKIFTSLNANYSPLTLSMLYSNENDYFKKITSVIKHELVHYIEQVLKNPEKYISPKNLKTFYAPGSDTNFKSLGFNNYYDSNIELKAQIMSIYSELSSYYRNYKITYENLASLFDPSNMNMAAAMILAPFYYVANNEKRTLMRLKTLLNMLYKNKKLQYDKKLEKKYLKIYLNLLKKRYKSYIKYSKSKI